MLEEFPLKKIYVSSLLSFTLSLCLLIGHTNALAPAAAPAHDLSSVSTHLSIVNRDVREEIPLETIVFRHGDVSWLPKLAAQAGWPKDTIEKLSHIVLRESGGCPNRWGGSVVDKNCVILNHDGSNHRSDSGLLQINGVHWKQDHPSYSGSICKNLKFCSQEQLLDPLNNLIAGKYLYDIAGWGPWDVCSWNPKACTKEQKRTKP